ncbi:cysteine hydrolase family protein [Streptomyces physcomitrii]|uniref:Cysteine hydrolase n=1 Tax=Streptomyces physcomitrii TaxID=2724184 RepID=A0ABX1GYI8_9ACTN|nr:isochorismatase family cysteine hydrolase [Streptomyces physcomitrii]NKI41143.1 cysteine hydrolase [Streptomyces physcomitrii]
MDYTAPQWDASALLVIDVQRDFLDEGAAPIAGTSQVLDELRLLVDGFRAAGRLVVHVVRLYTPGDSDVDLPRRAAVEGGLSLVAPGSPGSQLVPAVLGGRYADLDSAALLTGKPQPLGAEELALFKPRWSAFHRTGLEELLRERGVTTVVVAGCNLPNCPRATLFDASERDFRTVLVTDAVSQAGPERLADLAGIGVGLATSEEVLGGLGLPSSL